MIAADVLVVGSGLAGLWAAISAHDAGAARVALVDKAGIAMSSQSRMAAGATIYCLPEDDIHAWLGDFVAAHAGMCHQDFVLDLLATSFRRLRQLEAWGVEYARSGKDPLDYFRLPSRGLPHTMMLARPVHGRHTGGAAVVTALRREVARRRVARHSRIMITNLVMAGDAVAGAIGVDRTTGEVVRFDAGAVVLATGDCSFRGQYVGVDAATGDAMRLGFDAGARVTNCEFLSVNTGSPVFGFEGTGVALRFGGTLVDATGREFMRDHHPDGNAAEINHLVRAMADEVRAGHGPPLYLDLTSDAANFPRAALRSMGGFMPVNLERLSALGMDPFESRQEWVPAIQTLRGGLRTDIDGHTDVAGLFAAGLAQGFDPGLFNGWSTARAMWSGERVGRAAAVLAEGSARSRPDADSIRVLEERAVAPLRHTGPDPDVVLQKLHEILFPWDVCLVKDASRLETALGNVIDLGKDTALMRAADPHELVKAHETANMVCAAELFLRASLAREESRHSHFREDRPHVDNDRFLGWFNLRRTAEGSVQTQLEPVPIDTYPLPVHGDTAS